MLLIWAHSQYYSQVGSKRAELLLPRMFLVESLSRLPITGDCGLPACALHHDERPAQLQSIRAQRNVTTAETKVRVRFGNQ
jgi:hypothetical protein